MRKVLAIALVVLGFGAASFAQSESKAEVFGGYQYTNIDIHEVGAGKNRINLNGWNAALTGYFNKNLGITADFSGAYGTPDLGGGEKAKTKAHTYMFGPAVRFGNDKLQPYVHGLFGGVHYSVDGASNSVFGMALGGGLDVAAKKNVAIRVGQFDYLYNSKIDGASDHQNNFRYSAGVVFRF